MATADRTDPPHSAVRSPQPAKAKPLSETTGRARWDAVPQNQRRHLALQPEDTADQTFGCRASNPDACGKHGMRSVCAFVREDGICLAPPRSWTKQYPKLLAAQRGEPIDPS